MELSVEDIIEYMLSNYEGVKLDKNWGERGLFYNPEGLLPKGVYIMTFKEADGDNDRASHINRGGIYRINLGISKESFKRIFGEIPTRPSAGGVVSTGHDFQELNQITPHPVYGWMSWIAVLNPSVETFNILKPIIAESVKLAHGKYRKRMKPNPQIVV